MLIKNTLTQKALAFIRKLRYKKYRIIHHCFIAEGIRAVSTLLASSYSPLYLVVTSRFSETQAPFAKRYQTILHTVSSKQFGKLSSLRTPQGILLVVKDKPLPLITPTSNQMLLMLDNIQNPGNLGTILRIANWYGIAHIIASPNTVDHHNPKVVQSSMGFIPQVHYTPLLPYVKKAREKQLPIIGAVMNGNNLHQYTLPYTGCLIIGNETHGIHSTLLPYLDHRITIPCYGQVDSLNAAMATAIICDRWREPTSPTLISSHNLKEQIFQFTSTAP